MNNRTKMCEIEQDIKMKIKQRRFFYNRKKYCSISLKCRIKNKNIKR